MWRYRHSLSLVALLFPVNASADAGFFERVLTGDFTYILRGQTSYTGTALTEGAANPENQFALLPEQYFTGELRPDFSYTTENVDLKVSPRLIYDRSLVVTERDNRDLDAEATLFINEWRVGYIGFDSWDFWVGRHALIWGPATSLTPSNPFFIDPGRISPYLEVDGRDFFAGSWLGPAGWTLSYFDNFGEGRVAQRSIESDSFKNERAIKVDWSGPSSYWSANYSWRDGRPDHLGAYYQATHGDAWLSYMDLGYTFGRTQLDPFIDADGIWRFSSPDDGELSGIAILGISYTMLSGSSINLEFLHNNQGWGKSENENYNALLQQAGSRFENGSNEAAMTLAQAAQPGSHCRTRTISFRSIYTKTCSPTWISSLESDTTLMMVALDGSRTWNGRTTRLRCLGLA